MNRAVVCGAPVGLRKTGRKDDVQRDSDVQRGSMIARTGLSHDRHAYRALMALGERTAVHAPKLEGRLTAKGVKTPRLKGSEQSFQSGNGYPEGHPRWLQSL